MEHMDRNGCRETLIPMVDAAKALARSYQSLHNDVLRGRIAGEKIDGRWYVAAKAVRDLTVTRRRSS